MDEGDNTQLVFKLAKLLSHPPISIEILPGGLAEWASVGEEQHRPTTEFPFLYIEKNLGVPKKVLYKLYLVAVGLFRSSRSAPELCRDSSSVILLANPAHQTALNARKRLVESGFLAARKEIEFTEILFRGSSDCAKQSILWDHRRWLFGRVYASNTPISIQLPFTCGWATSNDAQALSEFPPDIIEKEFGIIRRAYETHPRNYHAWTHWHFTVNSVRAQLSLNVPSPRLYLDILVREYVAICHWVDHHVSDHSAMYHLCSLGRLFRDLETYHPHYNIGALLLATTYPSLVEHALSLTESYPSHESLWIYLREAATLLAPDNREKLIERVGSSSMSQSYLAKKFFSWTAAHVNKCN